MTAFPGDSTAASKLADSVYAHGRVHLTCLKGPMPLDGSKHYGRRGVSGARL